jgi:glycylpeptide N-tetradecanoyltransferase
MSSSSSSPTAPGGRFWPEFRPARGAEDAVPSLPCALPAGFEWCTLDLTRDADLQQLHAFLAKHYVSDPSGTMRLVYPAAMLRRALLPPDYHADWHVGVRVARTGKLVGCVTGVPAALRIQGETRRAAEVNFLCVHAKLRARRLAPVLIRELARRITLARCWHAIFTSGQRMPDAHLVASCPYVQRALALADDPPLTPRHPAFRPFDPQTDADQTCALLNAHLAASKVARVFCPADIAHLFGGDAALARAHVLPDPHDPARISDVLSFTLVDVARPAPAPHMCVAYVYYLACPRIGLADLTHDLAALARAAGADILFARAFDNHEAAGFRLCEELLHVYVHHNWATEPLAPEDIGVFLV